MTIGGIALVADRAVLVPLVDEEGELDTTFRRYVFRLPRALAFRTREEEELVRRRIDIGERSVEILGPNLEDGDALVRLVRPRPRPSPRAVALYRPGPRWNRDKPLAEQPSFAEHVDFLARLGAEGVLDRAGPFHELSAVIDDVPVGLVVFRTGDILEAESRLERDPALRARVMEAEVLAWHL